MAVTSTPKVSELYDAALAAYMLVADWAEPFSELKARKAVNELNKLIVLTPQMSANGEQRVSYDIEQLVALRASALHAGAGGGRAISFEDPLSRL